MMKRLVIVLASLVLLGSQLACCVITLPEMPRIPDLPDIPDPPDLPDFPEIEVGEMAHRHESVSANDVTSARVEVLLGSGELDVEAGESDELLSADFDYNVAVWEPEVVFESGTLIVKQGSFETDWGVPTGAVRNQWDLAFSPDVVLDLRIRTGAGEGDLDLRGLQLENLDLDVGAGDVSVRFGPATETRLTRFSLDSGASKVDVEDIGDASPEEVRVQGGVGEITLDFSGNWARSADVQVAAGMGALTLFLPDDVGVQVDVEGGLASVDTTGLRRRGDTYVNEAYGEAEITLDVQVTTGVGSLRLIEISNDGE